MNTQPIREFNRNAIINIEKYLEFNADLTNEPVSKTLTFESFEQLTDTSYIILDAIETIGFISSNSKDLGVIGGLASILKKILPYNEAYFLDSLLIKKEGKKEVFEPISNL